MAEMKVSNTEDSAVTPGWVDQELDEIFAGLPAQSAGQRAAYAECLAASRTGDVEGAHDRCRTVLLEGLRGDGVEAAALARLVDRLEALEAEITTRT